MNRVKEKKIFNKIPTKRFTAYLFSIDIYLVFPKIKIKVRNEVVTLGAGRFDVAKETATELPAHELEKWYENGEDFVVLDLRNDYEIASGKFEKTIDKFIHFKV